MSSKMIYRIMVGGAVASALICGFFVYVSLELLAGMMFCMTSNYILSAYAVKNSLKNVHTLNRTINKGLYQAARRTDALEDRTTALETKKKRTK